MTSFGFDVVEFARDVLKRPLDPWQEFVVVHAGELLEDGRPRFRKVLVIVSRQQGKTELGVVLSLYWLFVEKVPLVLGTSTKLAYAVESWEKALAHAERVPELAGDIPKRGGIRRANGETALKLSNSAKSRYLVAASNEEGGRSLTIDRLILDELRQHHDYSAWDAAVPATDAVPDAQIWALTNAGSDRSIVLNDLQSAATSYIDTGDGDERLGLFEYSAPPGSSPLDLDALAHAAPNLGRRNDADALIGDARRAVDKGGDVLNGFLTERMCIRIAKETPPVWPAETWEHCRDPKSRRVGDAVLALDVAPDRSYSAVSMAALNGDGLPMGKVVRHGPGATWAVPHIGEMVRAKGIRRVVVDNIGPAKNLIPDLQAEVGEDVEVLVMKSGDVTDAFADLFDGVVTEQVRHLGQPELDAAIEAATTRLIDSRKAWDRRHEGDDITCLVSYTHAMWGLAQPQEQFFAASR